MAAHSTSLKMEGSTTLITLVETTCEKHIFELEIV